MPRILHLGLGAFHRAHQAVYLQRLHELGDTAWTLAAGNLRGDAEAGVRQLQAQQGAYTLETVSPDRERRYERITSLRQVIAWDPQLSGLVTAAADPDTRIISFTVTEGGYALSPSGGLDPASVTVREALDDMRQGRPGQTWHGALVAMLRARMRADAGPVTLLSCDNLRHNGDRTREALLQFLDLAGDTALRDWVATSTSSPNCMVDRITPRPTPEVGTRVRAATGRDDPCALMAESFIQWVIEDRFVAGRPAWERVGVEMTQDVSPYEEAKIRLLNATHSAIAWGGTLAGFSFIHEGARSPRVRALAYDYATDGAIPLLEPSPVDLARYRDTVLDRFGNEAILDTNQRVASDSFAKIPAFIAPTVRERIARQLPLQPVAILAGLFLAFLQRWDQGRHAYAYQDQALDEQVARRICRSSHPPAALAALGTLWGDAAGQPAWAAAVSSAHARVVAAFAS